MLYNITEIAKNLNISKVTAYARLKLEEIKPFIIKRDGNNYVDEKDLKAIKNSLNYNQSNISEEEVASSTMEIDVLKEDMIDVLKTNIEFLKKQINIKDQQLLVKDNQIQKKDKLFENTQVLFKNMQVQNLNLPVIIKEHDIELVNTLTKAMQKQKEAFLNEQNKRKENIFNGILGNKK